MVQSPAAGTHSPDDSRKAAEGNRARHVRRFHAVPFHLAARCTGHAASWCRRHTANSEATPGLRNLGSGLGIRSAAPRVARYSPELLDRLCLSGEVMWGRLSPHPSLVLDDATPRSRRIRPTRVAPVAIFLREDAPWLLESTLPSDGISASGREIFEMLKQRGASFLPELAKTTGLLTSQVEDGLWELAAAGLVTADGFENLRALVDPKRRRGEGSSRLKM